MEPLPIDSILPDIVAGLRAGTGLVLTAPPGAGKTTRVPRTLYEAGLAGSGEIVILEPRRLAARLAAARVADEMGERIGATVGFNIRFEKVDSPRTRIRFVTEGILSRRIVHDPLLSGISVLIVDEFHERHIHTDLALAYVRQLQCANRPDLKIIVMSATLKPDPISAFLGHIPVLQATGRRFDLIVEYESNPSSRMLHDKVASAVARILEEVKSGDILVFLPGATEIRRATDILAPVAERLGFALFHLHGDLPAAEQSRVVQPIAQRKVILATNVAETSVTIPGITAVIDSGLVRIASHSAWTGLPRIEVTKTSKSSAEQRAGRAGRTGPGRVLRLYTRSDFDSRPEQEVPEIRKVDLAEILLALHGAGVGNIPEFKWFEAPPNSAIQAAEELLLRLGATDEQARITSVGRQMLRFPVHPRLGRLLVEGERTGVHEEVALTAALLSERDIRLDARSRIGQLHPAAPSARAVGRSDVLELMDCFQTAAQCGFAPRRVRDLGLDPSAVEAVARAHRQILKLMERVGQNSAEVIDREDNLLLAILAAFPDRVAQRRRHGSKELLLAEGGSAELSAGSVVHAAPLMVAVEAEERKKAPHQAAQAILVRLASEIRAEWLAALFPNSISEETELFWNDAAARVDQKLSTRYGKVTLEEMIRPAPPSGETSRILLEALRERALAPLHDGNQLEPLQSRFELVRRHFPAQRFPMFPDLHSLLTELCREKRSFSELARISVSEAVLSALTPAQRDLLRREAPERVTLPSGRSLRVNYDRGRPPWIEARLQEFLGMFSGPAICGGKLPLTLHLLAPNGRAVQVTQDLAGFWRKHYPAVRKELQRRYPKHAWPENPLSQKA